MRFLTCLWLFLVGSLSLSAQTNTIAATTEINFIHEDFAGALKKAKAENKILFVDMYTTWCGPCKKMARETFKDADVADYYNNQFVNLKLDMEEGQGPDILKQYGVSAFPTLMFLNGDGEVVHKGLGYHDAEQFLELGRTAVGGEGTLATWNKRYDSGDRNPEFLREFAQKLQEAYESKASEVAQAYMATQTDWTTTDNLTFIVQFAQSTDDIFFKYMIENMAAFEAIGSQEEIKQHVFEIIGNALFDQENPPSLEKADSLIAMLYTDDAAELKRRQASYRPIFWRLRGDAEKYAEAAVVYLAQYNTNTEELIETCTTFIDHIDDKKMLEKAVEWGKMAVKAEPYGENYLVLAKLYQKLGETKKAKKTAKKGLKIAKKAEGDTEELEALLKDLN